MADFDYSQSSKENKKKYKPKKELKRIIKEHEGPENTKAYNTKFAEIGSEGLPPYPGGLGPDADEGSPDTGPWDEDWN